LARNSSFPKLFVSLEDNLVIFEHENDVWDAKLKLENTEPQCVAIDPFKPTRVYCGTFGKGLWASDDSGDTWRQIGHHEITSPVTSLAVSPKEQVANGFGVVYVGTEPSMLYRSEDGANTWKNSREMLELESSKSWSFPPKPYTHHVRTIVPDPNRPRLVYLAIEAGALIRSFNGGKTWNDRVLGGPYDTHNLAASPNSPGRLYSAAGDGFFESYDFGDSWKTPDEGLKHSYLYCVAVHPKDPDTILVSASDGPWSAYNGQNAESYVYRKEGDHKWEEVREGVPPPRGTTASFLTPNPLVKKEFYAGNNTGLYRTGDGGRTWTKLRIPREESLFKSQHVHHVALGQ
jgi:photosystem II stability/assembly factor-like uncharacterized protein